MLSFKAPRRTVLLALGLAGVLALSGCSSLTPVYGDRSTLMGQALRQAKPSSVAEQVIYQTLAVSFPISTKPADPELRISASAGERGLSLTDVARATSPSEMVVTANVELLDADGKVLHSFWRTASASFETDWQGFSSAEAKRDATDRAAKAVAELIRLSLFSALSGSRT
jgi:hypothetical protein